MPLQTVWVIRRAKVPLQLWALAICLILILASCSGAESKDRKESPVTNNRDLVCGLIDPALVEKVIGTAEVGTRGTGIIMKDKRAAEPAVCTVQDKTRSQTVIQVSVGEIDDIEGWQSKLRSEQRDATYGTCHTYDGDPGYGYGCVYDSGTWIFGAGVNVIRSERLLRVVVHHWDQATVEQRMKLAEDITRNVDHNVEVFDQKAGS